VFLREGYAGYFTPCRVLVVVLIIFLSTVRGLEFLLLGGGHRGSPAVRVRSVRSLCTAWGRTPNTSRVVDFHAVVELGLQCLERRDSSARRCRVKCWASVYLGEMELLVPPGESRF
jgi:hypothetical protein